jgi:acetyl-CoA carboxylase biotin carboxyl carrier protein
MVKPFGESPISQVFSTKTEGNLTTDGEEKKADGGKSILAPLPSIFYSAPGPDADDYVKVGMRIKKGMTVCVLEAMKMMNEISMPEDGMVTSICVKNGDAVEANQPLFTYIVE